MLETPDERFLALGDEIPPPATVPPDLSFTPWRQYGNVVVLAGHGPSKRARPPQFDYVGQVGSDLTDADGYAAARLCGLGLLVTLRNAIGTLDDIHQILQMIGAVNSAPDFVGQSYVLNGASDLMTHIFGPIIGRPARMAFGATRLPFNMAVEICMSVEIEQRK